MSHTAPELQGTSFAYYLAQGIQGDADSNGDDEITLHELHEYVQRQVGSFAHRRRAEPDRAEPYLEQMAQKAPPRVFPLPLQHEQCLCLRI